MFPKLQSLLTIVFVLTISLFGCGKSDKPVPEGHFTGDLVIQGSVNAQGTIQKMTNAYRIDLVQEGKEYFFTTFQDSAIIRLFSPEKNGYFEFDISGQNVFRNDPFNELARLIHYSRKDLLGSESTNGYLCDKYVMFDKDDEKILTYWLSQKLRFPIKIEDHREESKTVEILNIKETVVGPEIFKIPEGYTLLTIP